MGVSPTYVMYAATLNGELMLAHISFRAREVRLSVARSYLTRSGWGTAFPPERTNAWKLALKDGWRVVPVFVSQERFG